MKKFKCKNKTQKKTHKKKRSKQFAGTLWDRTKKRAQYNLIARGIRTKEEKQNLREKMFKQKNKTKHETPHVKSRQPPPSRLQIP